MSKLATLIFVDAEFDLSVEDPSVFGAEDFEVNARVVAAHFAPASYLPSCCDVLCITPRDTLLPQKVRYKMSYVFGRCRGPWEGWRRLRH